MNIKKILVAVFALSTTIAFAQEQRIKEESKTIFKPHWFIQAQIGAAHTVGEGEFTDLISPAAALNVGYKFAPAFGARVGVSGWQAKGGWVNPRQNYQYKYLQGNDKFNSKKAGNCDWQLNALVGVSIRLGKSYTKTAPVYYEPEPVVTEQPKPAPVVEQPQPKKEVVIELLKQNIFFALNSAKIQDDQQAKISSLVEYLEKHSAAKVSVTGYADKETGNPNINMTLSEKRAKNVIEMLKAKGVAADRIVIGYKGDTVQPYQKPEENRVCICIAE